LIAYLYIYEIENQSQQTIVIISGNPVLGKYKWD